MIERTFVIKNRLGLHARAAAVLVKTVSRFKSEVLLEKEGLEINAKSIMGVLMLAAPKDSEVKVSVEGIDEGEAMAAIAEIIEDGFGED